MKKVKLSDLLQYNKIYIQCHDNPDADAIASGYALYRYFSDMGKKVVFFCANTCYFIKSTLKCNKSGGKWMKVVQSGGLAYAFT